ncbi:flavin-containing monooxygenase [Gordonia soli]|uniref:Putative flavin-containing monooxygenase n=1 Tax=Gordonia soli NBRC 108243 TaxID=1223545 RepID=M0QKD3_9ACTN|nr:NAD(P)/FAD-dependent oxidoreductase [Gordonia soli]GAC67867.1 putative flavin-containing monooxygenase [Gordonia soli NBRC 108243]
MTSVIIIGAGFGGMGVAIELLEHGSADLLILERAAEVGGVWRDNAYPAAGVDTPSPLYSYSFAPKTDWTFRFAMRDEIFGYAQDVAERYGLRERIRFGSDVVSANWDEHGLQWSVTTADGAEFRADVVVSAVGQLSQPAMPAIDGIDEFDGTSVHSARWDPDIEIADRRVAVIGTGASAAQLIPGIAPDVGELTVFQRHAPWVFRKMDVEYPRWRKAAFKYLRGFQLGERLFFFAMLDTASLGLVDVPAVRRPLAWLSRRHLRRQVPDPRLREKVTPDYEVGCKRVVFSDAYLPALGRDNVSVVTEAIDAVVPQGVRTADGTVHEVDVIVYATGFRATDFLWSIAVTGRGGRTLADVWDASGGATGYLGMAVPNFPNLFMVVGPNTSLSAGSLIYVIESQARYIRQAVELIGREPGRALEVSESAATAFDDEMQQKLRRSVLSRCASWYRHPNGRVTSSWPDAVFAYRRRTRRLDPSAFTFVSSVRGTETPDDPESVDSTGSVSAPGGEPIR